MQFVHTAVAVQDYGFIISSMICPACTKAHLHKSILSYVTRMTCVIRI